MLCGERSGVGMGCIAAGAAPFKAHLIHPLVPRPCALLRHHAYRVLGELQEATRAYTQPLFSKVPQTNTL